MKRLDFVFAVGFDGGTAIVDGRAMRRYGSLSTQELADRGLYRAAFASAIYSKSDEEVRVVLEAYNRAQGTDYAGKDDLKRVFGVDEVGDAVTKVKVI